MQGRRGGRYRRRTRIPPWTRRPKFPGCVARTIGCTPSGPTDAFQPGCPIYTAGGLSQRVPNQVSCRLSAGGNGFEPSVPRPIFDGFEAPSELDPTAPRRGGSAEQLRPDQFIFTGCASLTEMIMDDKNAYSSPIAAEAVGERHVVTAAGPARGLPIGPQSQSAREPALRTRMPRRTKRESAHGR
jgi:hypothetical protein